MSKKIYFSLLFNFLLGFCFSTSTGQKSCLIFENLNCSCFQSADDFNSSLIDPFYSHLYCQGNLTNQKKFQLILGSDVKYENRFRSVSFEFDLGKEFEIQSGQFDCLSLLFSQTARTIPIEISIRFSGYTKFHFQSSSFTSKIFQEKHQFKSLSLNLFPKIRSNSSKISSTNEELIKFSRNSFSGLNVKRMNIYVHSKEEIYLRSTSFEWIFNQTKIEEIHFYGSIFCLSDSSSFQGSIQSLIIHRRVDTIDSNEFPFYPSVISYGIHSIGSHSMNLTSFLSSYKNLRSLEISNPRFEFSLDENLPQLESLTLDVESLNEKTFLFASNLKDLKLGLRLRRIDSQIFLSFPVNLRRLDLSQIDFNEMTSESRCILLSLIVWLSARPSLNLIFPSIENVDRCHCDRLFLEDLQSLLHSTKENGNEKTCSVQCYFSECRTVNEYFRRKSSPLTDENPLISHSNGTNEISSSADLFPDQIDFDLIQFLQSQSFTSSPTSSLSTSLSSTFDDQTTSNVLQMIEKLSDEPLKSLSKDKILSSKSIFIFISIVLLLFVICLIIVISCAMKKSSGHHRFKRVPDSI